MKKLYFAIVVFILFFQTTHAQYHPLLDNPSWIFGIANFGGGTNVMIDEPTDIVINGVTYKKFIDTTYGNEEVFLREDTAAQRVFKRVNNVDVLLYDFSLQQGDVIVLGSQTLTANVSTVLMADGTTRKEIYLNNFFVGETWIEGVGSTRYAFRRSFEEPQDPYVYLQCSFQGGVNMYNTGLVNTGTPTNCATLGTIENQFQMMAISPNPMTTSTTISANQELANAELLIYNPLGQLVKQIKNIHGSNILVNKDNLENGIYFLQLLEGGKLIASHKLIVAD